MAIEELKQKMTKKYGAGSVITLGDDWSEDVEGIPTGSKKLDQAIGVGGIPRGRIIEIFGTPSGGKTTLCLSILAQAQKLGDLCAFVDAEHAMDVRYAQMLGVDPSVLLFSQPDSGEQGLQIIEDLVTSGELRIGVVDSVASLIPQKEIDGEIGDVHVGLQARMMSQALRKLTPLCKKNNCTLIFVNQIRQKIGVMFGNKETTSGGEALRFYTSVRLDIRREGNITQGDKIVGVKTKVKVVKNKVAPPFGEAHFDLYFGQGISESGDLIDRAIEKGIITKAGAWYSFGEMRLGQGKVKTAEFLKDHPIIMEEIEVALGSQDGELQL